MTDGMLLAETQGDPRLLRIRHASSSTRPTSGASTSISSSGIAEDPPSRAARPQAHHHLGHPRHREVPRAPSTTPPVIQVGGRMYPGRGRIPAARSRGQARTARPITSTSAVKAVDASGPRRPPGDILDLHAHRAGHPRDLRNASGGAQVRRTSRSCRSSPACPAAEQGRVYSVTGPKIVVATNVAETSLDHPGHPLRRRHRPGPHRPVPARNAHQQPAHPADLAERAPTSARAAAAASRTASASGSTPRTTTTRGRASPRRRSCAPTWPRSSCA